MYKIYDPWGAFIGKAPSINACIRYIHEWVDLHNLQNIMVEPSRYNVKRSTVYEYDIPAWVEPEKVVDGIKYRIAGQYSYARKGISTGSKLSDNVVVINYGHEDDYVTFTWEEV